MRGERVSRCNPPYPRTTSETRSMQETLTEKENGCPQREQAAARG